MGSALVGSAGAGKRSKPGMSDAQRLAEAEQILVDRMNGVRPSELAAKYGYSRVTINKRINMAVEARLAPTVDKYREMQGAQLDEVAATLEKSRLAATELIQQAINREDIPALERGLDSLGKVMDRVLRLAERRAKLYGLDAPIKVDANVTVVEGNVDAEVARLAAELGV